MTPKDFFLYVGAMVALYWSAGSLIALLFTISDAVFQDELQYYFDPYSSGMRFAIASLVVVFPISLLLFRKIKQEVSEHKEKLLLPVRRWLYALTIFITAVTLIGDGISLLNTFLGGEVTARFISKTISILVVAGLILWYSWREIRSSPDQPVQTQKAFMYGTPALVLAIIIYSFTVMGSPTTARNLRFDAERVQDISAIQWQIVNYWQQKEALPKSLAELEDPISGYRNPVDPRTGSVYEFRLGEGASFTLCATFDLPSPETPKGATNLHLRDPASQSFEHGVGHTCFERVIDPELYPVRPIKSY